MGAGRREEGKRGGGEGVKGSGRGKRVCSCDAVFHVVIVVVVSGGADVSGCALIVLFMSYFPV